MKLNTLEKVRDCMKNGKPEFSEKFLRFIIQEVIRHHEQAAEMK